MAHRRRQQQPVPPCHLQGAIVTICSLIFAYGVRAAVIPISNCYALDAHSRLYDLTSLYGKELEKKLDQTTYTLRFCKDLQQRSRDSGYVSFGSYESGTTPISPNTPYSFSHEYTHGDLSGCENYGSEFDGRNAEVLAICGSRCPNSGDCKDSSGCICSITLDVSDKPCLASMVVAVPCPEPGPQVVAGFSVGFSPRGSEVVTNGLTQWGFENDQHTDYRFLTSQAALFLYFSAPSSVATDIGKPSFTTTPSSGLEVKLSGTAASGTPPTTLTPSLLEVYWRCEVANSYVVNISVPFKGYDPVVFSLLKLCEAEQTKKANSSSGWATFGVLSCLYVVFTTMPLLQRLNFAKFLLVTCLCCGGGFIYGTRVENKHGLEALPGIGIVSSCLDMASGVSSGYRRAEDVSAINRVNSFRDSYPPRTSAPQGSGHAGFDHRYGTVS